VPRKPISAASRTGEKGQVPPGVPGVGLILQRRNERPNLSLTVGFSPKLGTAPIESTSFLRQARNNLAQEAAAKTRHLNIWVGADEAPFSSRAWQAAADPDLRLEDFEGCDCHAGLDLASRTDLAALAIVFPRRNDSTGRMTYIDFARCYLNDAAILEARNPSYPAWAAAGHLVVTPGNETDFDAIEADLRN